MSEGKKVPLEHAEALAMELINIIAPYADNSLAVGSIRRRRKEVHDIDILVLPKPLFWNPYPQAFKDAVQSIKKAGEKIISGVYKDVSFDLYIANQKTWGTLTLIRTGSANHNIMLCREAKRRGWKLEASGNGLMDGEGMLISDSEEGILNWLLGKYIKPEEREA